MIYSREGILFMDRLLRQKRKISWLLLLVCCVLFNGCDPAFNRKPFNYPNTKWTCEDLNVWFIVDPAYTRIYYGQMEIDGSMCELGFFMGQALSVV